jgi:hypothetical protein
VTWLAARVRAGNLRWVLADGLGGSGAGPRLPGDTRSGSRTALAAVASVCRAVSLPASSGASRSASGRSASGTLYDCRGRASALLSARA